MTFPNDIPLLPPDPILSLPQAFNADSRSQKVNLGIGIYKDSEGASLLLNCVKKAEDKLLQKHAPKDYLPIEGDRSFIKCCASLIFGSNSNLILDENLSITQTIGGSGALRLCGEFLAKLVTKQIFISQPSWANHQVIFEKAGLNVGSYPYLNSESSGIDFDGFCSALRSLPALSAVVLQCSGHNPTGFDPSLEQWKELSEIFKQQKLIPLFDVAYHGFAESLSKDIQPVQYFAQQGHDLIVTYTFSKNLGLYGERVGCLAIVSQQQGLIPNIASQIKYLVRGNYSNPPIFGARIASTILQSAELIEEWKIELKNMHDRVEEMRHAFIAQLLIKGHNENFAYMHKQKGLFSLCGLTAEQVRRLKEDMGIYLPISGRINIAGLNTQNLEYVAKSIISVIEGR